MQQRTHQCGFARAKVALQVNDQTGLQYFCQFFGKGGSGGFVGQLQGCCEFPPCGGMPAYITWAIICCMQNTVPQVIDYTELARHIKEWGRALGFQAVGIGDTDLGSAEARLMEWLAHGYHGAMDYMAKHGARRARPAELLPGTLRVISLRMDYRPPHAADAWQVINDGERAFISRYALGRDYHKVLRNRLEKLTQRIRETVPGTECRVFTDSAPVMEVELAQRAHLGWRGKHTLLLSREHGSWFFLGEIYINLPLPVDTPGEDHCGSCARCIEICPTCSSGAPCRPSRRRRARDRNAP